MGQQILLIDDHFALVEAMQAWLQEAGYQVTTAHDGRTGLTMARRRLPELIVLDVKMPGLDGWQTLEALREHQTTAQIPVVLLTACDDPDNIRKCYELGGAWFYTKPIVHPDHLLLIIRRILATMAVSADQPAAASRPQADPSAS